MDRRTSVHEIPRSTIRGWSEPNLRKFLGLNHLRAFRQACG